MVFGFELEVREGSQVATKRLILRSDRHAG